MSVFHLNECMFCIKQVKGTFFESVFHKHVIFFSNSHLHQENASSLLGYSLSPHKTATSPSDTYQLQF